MNGNFICGRSVHSVKRDMPRLLMALCMALTLNISLGGATFAQQTEAESAIVTIVAPAHVEVGQLIQLQIVLEGEVQAGGFEAQLLYDRANAEFAGFAPASPPQDAGIGQLVTPELPGGSAVGFYTCPTDPCLEQREAQAAVDAGVLGQVELIPLKAGQLEVKVANLIVVESTGRRISTSLAQPSLFIQVGEGGDALPAPASTWSWPASSADVVVASATAADVTNDGKISHGDVMEVAMTWQVAREDGTPCQEIDASAVAELESYGVTNGDINGDSCVDIVDVQTAASYAGGEAEPFQFPAQIYLPQVAGIEEGGQSASVDSVYTVNSKGDDYDTKSSDNKCLTSSGVCTLRAAIQQSNSHAGPDTIRFAIPGEGVHTIQVGIKLPSLWDASGATVVDGYSQVGASPNISEKVSNAQIKIQVRGNGSEDVDGLTITSANNVVKGLAIFNMKRSVWIYGNGAANNVISGNFIGIDAAGGSNATVTSPMQAHGVQLEQGATGNTIGGVLPADRNIISGNARHGIGLWHAGTSGNVVYNNLVGLSPDGTHRIANRVHGIDINYVASNNTVGGTLVGQRNVIAGNNGSGAEVSHGAGTANNTIRGNYIGTDVSGNLSPNYTGNGLYGISLKDRVERNVLDGNVVANNLSGGIRIDNFGNCCTRYNTVKNNRVGIGVDGAAIGNALYGILILAPRNIIGPGNIIANNPVGIQVQDDASDGNKISQNSIFANVGMGIDLAPLAQANANDEGDVDLGPNEQLNYPVFSSVSPTVIKGNACANCTVEIFVADSGAGTNGEGRTFIGSGPTNASGEFIISVSGGATGQFVTATATDSTGNTSEFSTNFLIGTSAEPWEEVFAIPGRIEAENYRNGGSGVGYFDTTSGNSGRVYRSDSVDIEVTQDSSGSYDVAWVTPGEWLSFNTNIAAGGEYRFVARVATPSGNRKFHIEIDGINASGSVNVPWTGGWQSWANITVIIQMPAGQHELRFVAETDRINVNYFDIQPN